MVYQKMFCRIDLENKPRSASDLWVDGDTEIQITLRLIKRGMSSRRQQRGIFDNHQTRLTKLKNFEASLLLNRFQ